MLSGRYPTDRLSRHWNSTKSGCCSIPGCDAQEIGTLEHYLLSCSALNDARAKAISLCHRVSSEYLEAESILTDLIRNWNEKSLMQFLLDCSPFPEIISLKQCGKNAIVDRLFYVGRSWCYIIHRSRMSKTGHQLA